MVCYKLSISRRDKIFNDASRKVIPLSLILSEVRQFDLLSY